MANQARKKRRRQAKAGRGTVADAAARTTGNRAKAGTAKAGRAARDAMAAKPLWSMERNDSPHCGTYDGRRKQMTMTVEDIGPELAVVYSGKSEGNRRMNQHSVNRYANDMRRKRWPVTPQGISFDTNGVLMDGHTRLAAIIKSGETVKLAVFRDVPPEAAPFFDRGRIRLLKDVLARHGIESPAKVVYMVRAMVLGYNGARGGDVSEDQHLDIVLAYIDYIKWVLAELGKKQRAPVMGAILRIVVNEGTTERLRELCNHIRDNTNEGKDCPLNALKRYLDKVTAKSASGHHNDVYPRVAAAARAFLDSKKLTRLTPAKGDHWPFELD